ncbi:uncharacterized protein LOC111473601 isoform X2 [Cucurbita maxima]|uniref:Uncharacterized protein LOC111473601 isoform X2 n=1 Tax=Cucurbita maxima TaxID=3661 RepID=A0A6J1IHF9_CUCMA|nr:uncharacterized protein LOC111473601 isoform X2 [Cucurbita maxima]
MMGSIFCIIKLYNETKIGCVSVLFWRKFFPRSHGTVFAQFRSLSSSFHSFFPFISPDLTSLSRRPAIPSLRCVRFTRRSTSSGRRTVRNRLTPKPGVLRSDAVHLFRCNCLIVQKRALIWAYISMRPENGSKVEETLMEISRCVEDKNAAQDKQSTSSGQEKSHGMEAPSVEQSMMYERSEDMEIDIIGCTDNCEGGPSSECNDSTEYSSSFGDTVSGTDYGLLLDDEEVESQLYDDNNLQPISNGCREVFPRKKKLTDHWKKFISPVTWRCRWLELKIRKLQSQSSKYDRELALYDQRKQSVYEQFSTEDFDVKSTGFSSHTQRDRIMKRKKRKKNEETTEVASYMAHHNLFSYYEKKRSVADDISSEDKTKNMRHDGINDFQTIATDGWPSSMLGDNDNNLEEMFLKIEAAQSRVHELKNRIDKVVNENPMKFSSINQIYMLASSDDPASPEDGNDVFVRSLHEASQHMSEDAFDVLMPENAITSHGEVMLLPDMIQSADCGRSTKKVLVQDSAVKEEAQIHEEVNGQFIEQTLKLEEQITSPADLASGIQEPDMQHKTETPSAAKPSSSKKTRKRGRRKFGMRKQKRKVTG